VQNRGSVSSAGPEPALRSTSFRWDRTAAGESWSSAEERTVWRARPVTVAASTDRRQGAEGLLRVLIGFGAIGLATTHDLALGAIAEGWSPHAANVHFADKFDGGSLEFDYLLRPGPVKTSNALALMKSIGLDVEP
jgi:hypothetical protein